MHLNLGCRSKIVAEADGSEVDEHEVGDDDWDCVVGLQDIFDIRSVSWIWWIFGEISMDVVSAKMAEVVWVGTWLKRLERECQWMP